MAVAKKKCKHCGEYEYQEKGVKHPAGFFCTQDHAISFAQDKASKARAKLISKSKQVQVKKDRSQKSKDKARLQELKPISKLTSEAQAAVNKYIRLRDSQKPCVSCGSSPIDSDLITGSRFDAGHYRSRGSASHLKFNLLNIHKQCVKCNRFDSGNSVGYRTELINRIGIDRVEALENNNNPRKFTAEYLNRVKRIFNKRARFYEKRRG